MKQTLAALLLFFLSACSTMGGSSHKSVGYNKKIDNTNFIYLNGEFGNSNSNDWKGKIIPDRLRDAKFEKFGNLLVLSLQKLIPVSEGEAKKSHAILIRPIRAESSSSAGAAVRVYFLISLVDTETKKQVWTFNPSLAAGGLLMGEFNEKNADNLSQLIKEKLIVDGLL